VRIRYVWKATNPNKAIDKANDMTKDIITAKLTRPVPASSPKATANPFSSVKITKNVSANPYKTN
jgi:hypothetical protein